MRIRNRTALYLALGNAVTAVGWAIFGPWWLSAVWALLAVGQLTQVSTPPKAESPLAFFRRRRRERR